MKEYSGQFSIIKHLMILSHYRRPLEPRLWKVKHSRTESPESQHSVQNEICNQNKC